MVAAANVGEAKSDEASIGCRTARSIATKRAPATTHTPKPATTAGEVHPWSPASMSATVSPARHAAPATCPARSKP